MEELLIFYINNWSQGEKAAASRDQNVGGRFLYRKFTGFYILNRVRNECIEISLGIRDIRQKIDALVRTYSKKRRRPHHQQNQRVCGSRKGCGLKGKTKGRGEGIVTKDLIKLGL